MTGSAVQGSVWFWRRGEAGDILGVGLRVKVSRVRNPHVRAGSWTDRSLRGGGGGGVGDTYALDLQQARDKELTTSPRLFLNYLVPCNQGVAGFGS